MRTSLEWQGVEKIDPGTFFDTAGKMRFPRLVKAMNLSSAVDFERPAMIAAGCFSAACHEELLLKTQLSC